MTERDLLARARREGTPLLDGDRATFVWRGRAAPRLIGDFTDWEEEPLQLERAGDGVWLKRLDLYSDAYVEYAFADEGGRVSDPYNRRAVPNGIGGVNHFFYMPRARPTPYADPRPDVPHGRVTSHLLNVAPYAATARRRLHLYAPAAPPPWPLLVVLDGDEYVRRAHLPTIVDNLIAARRIRPLAIAALAADPRSRRLEYDASDATVALIVERLLPFARQRLDLVDRPEAHALLGASLGGLMAAYAALRAPAKFGAVLAQSGPFALGGRDSVVFDLAREGDARRPRFWLDVGHLEAMAPANRRLRATLASRGYEVHFRAYHAGHNWTAWRDELPRGLELAFGR